MTDDVPTSETQEKIFDPKIRWVIPQRLDFMTFVGKDVLAVAHDLYIVFLNFKTNTELVYLANNKKLGDGVDVIAGHKTNTFAFAEKVQHPRIFILSYPSFAILAQMKDTEVNRYKSLCMMENDLVAGFSGFPNYIMTVWSWRTQQRLVSVATGVVRRKQIYMSSRSHLLVCQCWGEGLVVWEVAPCYKRCLVMRRAKEECTGWDISDPSLVAVCWTTEGQLYAIDGNANLYSVGTDGIGMVTSLEWSEGVKGQNRPSMCSFGIGILIFGPDENIRWVKKSDKKWKEVWKYSIPDVVMQLLSNSTCDEVAAWTYSGMVFNLVADVHDENNILVTLVTFKQRNINQISLIAPDYAYVATLNNTGVLCLYDVMNGNLVSMKYIEGEDVSFQASPTDPLVVVFGEVGHNYGVALYSVGPGGALRREGAMCLTHQIVSKVVFSPTGRELVAAAMSAGHIFILKLSEDYKLTLVRYTELGRGLADCFLMRVGEFMRCFSLVLFSDKYLIGERIICINAETGKDNKFAGKMCGPYARLVPLGAPDSLLAIPHLHRDYHILKLSGDKGVTVSVKMGAIIDSGHDIKQFDGNYSLGAVLTFDYGGTVIKRTPDAPEDYDFKLAVTHRYESGIKNAVIDANNEILAHLANNLTMAVQILMRSKHSAVKVKHERLDLAIINKAMNTITIIGEHDKNYLDLQEEKKVREETMDYKRQREDIVKNFEVIQAKLVELLQENIAEVPLHQLSLSEFNLHMEHKKERLKQAEKEREEIRMNTEARIVAQNKVTAWIKAQCWDTMLTPRTKIFAIFSYYQVENYAVLPTQRDNWPELQRVIALREVEMDNDADLFRPWEEQQLVTAESEVAQTKEEYNESVISVKEHKSVTDSQMLTAGECADDAVEEAAAGAGGAELAGSGLARCIPAPRAAVPQLLVFSFLHMNWMYQIVKLNVQNMRLWFNKQFDDLMNVKKREVGLVEERNARLRFIIEELNKLSDLRGSFHHLHIEIKNPEWRQEEQPWKLIKVEPNECSIEPYVSPSQIVVVPPDPGPKDDFRERALIDMMDGVLEKLWHEEIKKPIPMPLCMLEKDPEHFNEDDLRLVFDYEAKVAFRNEERDKYRKMLHAEYAKLSTVLNEGIVKFNQKVKDMWLMKLKVDSIIGQENLILMRLRRTNLDRVEMAEKLEEMRNQMARLETEMEILQQESLIIDQQIEECNNAMEALVQKDRQMEKSFKNHFADLSPIIVDQCYKFYKKRPKWHQRASLTGAVLAELAAAVLPAARSLPPLLHPDCLDYLRGMAVVAQQQNCHLFIGLEINPSVEQLDQISNMPPVMDEALWNTMCKLRRIKIENEIRIRALAAEAALAGAAAAGWGRAGAARRAARARLAGAVVTHRERLELLSRNRTVQLVLPAGQVEIVTTGHMEDFEDAALIPREDIDIINNVILKVGDLKLRMMRKQMEFRKGILAKEWEHGQMMMKLQHMEQELYSYKRLKIPKELQLYLKTRELGYTEEQDYVRMEKEMEASKVSVNKMLNEQIHRYEELELKLNALEAESSKLNNLISGLNVKVSEKRLNYDPLEPIRVRRTLHTRMEMLVMRSRLIREVQEKHTTIVLLQTELELLRLKTYPTLASFRTLDAP